MRRMMGPSRCGSLPGVIVAGMVPPGESGVHHYGRLLALELRRRGFNVHEHWVVSEGRYWRQAVAASGQFLRLACSTPGDTSVIWNYSSFAYGYRGLSLGGVFFGVVLRFRGSKVVTVLHELTYPFGRRGWRGNVQALAQRLALQPVLAGSDVAVVTTAQRARSLSRRRWPARLTVHTAPVFSTIGAPEQITWGPAVGSEPVVGVLNSTGDGARPDVIVGALARVPGSCRPSLVLLGSPGPRHPAAKHWSEEAERRGVADRVMFSGVVSEPELRRRIESCDVIVLPNDHGPSGRRTTLGAALAHGIPTIALDGPERWQELAEADALEIVPPEEAAVAAALRQILGSPVRQKELSANGRAFYERHMAVELLGELMANLLSYDPPASGSRHRESRNGP